MWSGKLILYPLVIHMYKSKRRYLIQMLFSSILAEGESCFHCYMWKLNFGITFKAPVFQKFYLAHNDFILSLCDFDNGFPKWMNNLMRSLYFCNKIQQEKMFISSHWKNKCWKYNLCLEQQLNIKRKLGRTVSFFSESALNKNRQNMIKYVFLCIRDSETKHHLLDFGFLAV